MTSLRALKVVPVATLEDPGAAYELAAALAAGGLRAIEIAFRRPAAAEAIRAAAQVEGVLVGAGTVLSPQQALAAKEAGAAFAVAPSTDPEVVTACRDLALPFFPGVATPTEIQRALGLGCRVLKVFPAAQLGGPSFVRAVSATYPDAQFVPTGGIGIETVRDYLAVPSVVACGGSWLADSELVRAGRFETIEQQAREAVKATA